MNETSDKTELRTVDDFIAFFSAIPEEKWHRRKFLSRDGSKRCALGHLGDGAETTPTPNSKRLNELFSKITSVENINDRKSKRFPQRTPKLRILAALHEIKSHQQKE